MKVHSFRQKQSLQISRDKAWTFFSNPQNLIKLTPKWMRLKFQGDLPSKMHEGMIIIQQVKPVLGIPLTWVTEITHIENQTYFIDEQRIGPYKFWHHEHRLQDTENGVELIDTLHYLLPFGILGELAHQITVKRKIAEVFSYRYEVLETLFGKDSN